MLISVIIPVYNAETYLHECLESVKVCTSDEIECIIVNDGSTDKSEKICNHFVSADSRFKLINKKNTGVSDTRNTAVANAIGKYLFFLDADDFIMSDAWQEILSHATAGKYDMVAFGYYSLFCNGRTVSEAFQDSDDPNDVRTAILSTSMLNTCWGNLMSREVVLKSNIKFDENLKTGEDAVFMLDFVQSAEKSLLSSTCVLHYRIHAQSAMQQTSIESKLADLSVLLRRREEFLLTNYDKAAEWALLRQSFSVMTDLFRFQARTGKISETRRVYKKSLENGTLISIISKVQVSGLSPFYKKLEYILMKNKLYTCLAGYFKIKGIFK